MTTTEQKLAKLQRLSAELSTTLYLRHQEGATVSQLANITGLPVGVVAGLITAGSK